MKPILLGVCLSVSGTLYAESLYVDEAGACNGLTPCFTAIQDAVNLALPDTDVRIFPGNYVESVDLSLMGSTATRGPVTTGNIAFVGVDASNEPTNHQATVAPPAGAAFFHSGSFFVGDLVFDGLVVLSFDDDGIDLDLVSGDITVRDVIADNNGADGIDLEVATGEHTIFVESTQTHGNGSSGLNLDGPDGTTIKVHGAIANDNATEGLFVESTALSDALSVEVLNTVTNNNGQAASDAAGLAVVSDGSVLIAGHQSDDNAGPGIVVGASSATTIRDTQTNGNGIGSFFDGILLQSGGMTSIRRAVSNGNEAGGLWIASGPGDDHANLSVTCSQFLGNGHGVHVSGGIPNPAAFAIETSALAGNTTYGLFIGSDQTVDAANSWWGDASGPMHSSNPGGTGDVIADGVDMLGGSTGLANFVPFLTQAPTIKQYAGDTFFVGTFDSDPCTRFE